MTSAGRAFDLLRSANPVPVARRERSRRKRAAVLLVAVIIALCVLLVAPAIGIRVPPLDFWTAEKAPPEVVQDFQSLGEGAPAGMDPGAVPGQTRKVVVAGGHTFWVSPTRHGGFCVMGPTGGGCDKLGAFPLSVTWFAGRVPAGEMRGPVPQPSAFDAISGYAMRKYTDAVEVRFVGGASKQLDVTWVSEPIDAGFFYFPIPEGAAIESVVALDAERNVVTTEGLRARTEVPPIDALVERKQVALRLVTDMGEIVIWEAPTRYDGRCAWLEFRGRASRVAPCLPERYTRQAGVGISVRRFGGRPVLVGSCGYRALVLLQADGTSRTVPCERGLVLAELTAAELAGALRAIDDEGRPIARFQPQVSQLVSR